MSAFDAAALSATGSSAADLRLLGAVELYAGGRPIALGGRQACAVLALLALNRGHTVTTERLVEEIWEGDAPQSATARLHVLMSKMRARLREQAVDRAVRVSTVGAGYRLDIDSAHCDLGRFDSARTAAAAAQAAGRHSDAARLFRAALDEWSGPALADLAGFRFAQHAATRLEEERWACRVGRIDADIACGATAALIGELTMLTREKPYEEGTWAQLATALTLADRQADALESLRRAFAILREEGINPSPGLVELQRKILTQEKLTAAPTAAAEPRLAASTLARDPAASGGRLRLFNGRVVVITESGLRIGRMSDNDVVLDDPDASRYHAAIAINKAGIVIHDLQSTNGVHVNGQQIDQATLLNPGDVIRIGSTTMDFFQPD
ncbi:BTAD domain-containing putative transcriptional regulator [Nocardia huaxiensis]|uniref:FHA domain-containing protein n=1 Tax=Nocardia huaxiensis TaxID=2755382 RepID=A0A7D6V5M4_9NOCA|nr:BTAD domain-containing putative transcriptional regulator [Nocardia huaxiensis]QLY28032.1 FHA domain-containing protein [Nocardia huaxiensis]UFS98560.1 FHA domain-containing protein [Nocardia huaxiensis]